MSCVVWLPECYKCFAVKGGGGVCCFSACSRKGMNGMGQVQGKQGNVEGRRAVAKSAIFFLQTTCLHA